MTAPVRSVSLAGEMNGDGTSVGEVCVIYGQAGSTRITGTVT